MTAAFFDIDGTIYRNSLLIEHFNKLIQYDLVDAGVYDSRVKESYKLWDERKGDYDKYLEEAAETYTEVIRGLPANYNDFVSDQVLDIKGGKVYKYTSGMIKWHKEQGHLVIFISGSPDFLVSRMAAKLGADDYCGSVYQVEDGKLTGKISPMWDSGHKLEAIDRFCKIYDIELSKSYAYGDTNGDVTMLRMAGRPRAVNPSAELLRAIKNDETLKNKTEIIIERKDVIYRVNADVDTIGM